MNLKQLAMTIITIGGAGLLLASPTHAYFEDTCTAGTGATCNGEICCANETVCSTQPSICEAMLCLEEPGAPNCEAVE